MDYFCHFFINMCALCFTSSTMAELSSVPNYRLHSVVILTKMFNQEFSVTCKLRFFTTTNKNLWNLPWKLKILMYEWANKIGKSDLIIQFFFVDTIMNEIEWQSKSQIIFWAGCEVPLDYQNWIKTGNFAPMLKSIPVLSTKPSYLV